MAGQRQRVVAKGSEATPSIWEEVIKMNLVWGKKNHPLDRNITKRPAGPHTGWLWWVEARQTQNSDCIDLGNKKFKKNKKKIFFL